MKIGNFEITADKHNFILTETYEGKDRHGNPKTQVSEQRYYGRLEDALMAILQRGASENIQDDAVMFLDAMTIVSRDITRALESQNIPTRSKAA